jgi:hypothetical protein
VESGTVLAELAKGYSLASAFVNEGVVHILASRTGNGTWNDVTRFSSSELQTWEKSVAIRQDNEHLFDSPVCAASDGFVMAYETKTRPLSRLAAGVLLERVSGKRREVTVAAWPRQPVRPAASCSRSQAMVFFTPSSYETVDFHPSSRRAFSALK